MLDLDEALDSELVRARDMVVELDQPGAERRCACSARRSSCRARRPTPTASPGPALGEQTDEVLAALGYDEAQVAALERGGRRRRAGQRCPGELHGMSDRDGLLKMSELAERAGVAAGTIKHYLREGLLPEPVETSRNMAYYPPEFVERIRLIKQLQEERFMPLRVIKDVLDDDPERAAALVELEDRILERAISAEESRSGLAGRAANAATRSRENVLDAAGRARAC